MDWGWLAVALRIFVVASMALGAYHSYQQARRAGTFSGTAFGLITSLFLVVTCGFVFLIVYLAAETDSLLALFSIVGIYVVLATCLVFMASKRIMLKYPGQKSDD
jgi:hypothetical protein